MTLVPSWWPRETHAAAKQAPAAGGPPLGRPSYFSTRISFLLTNSSMP